MTNNLHNRASSWQDKEPIKNTIERADEINAIVHQETIPENFEIDEEGVWHLYKNKDRTVMREKVSSPLWVTGYTRDHMNNNHGRILEFKDIDGYKHVWKMPIELLAGENSKIIGALLNMGLWISTKRSSKEKLLEYINLCKPMSKARCVLQCGWFKRSFVLPSETIGYIQKERIIYQNPGAVEVYLSSMGALEDWQEKISKKAIGNSRLIFAISTAFAAPLLYLLNSENIGIHFRGSSSLGKSTAGYVANSVWGSRENIRTFRATASGLEGIASLHNDWLLCLDELGQISPNEAGHVIYMLGNGMGKTRSSPNALAKKMMTWRLVFLSTGELSLSQLMLEAGKRVKAGQEVRFIEIPADTGKYGLFENLHEFEGGAEFAKNLKDMSFEFFGTASRLFLEKLTEDVEGAVETLKAIINGFKQRYLPDGASAQVIRVFHHFATIAAAGEFASQLGITGWDIEEAMLGVWKCFKDWLESRGDFGMHEEKEAISQVRSYFELHGESRFTPWNGETSTRTQNRAGYRKETDNGTEFYVFKEHFRKEICKGLDYHYVEKICIQHKFLLPDSKGLPTRPERLPGSPSGRCYRFTSEIFAEEGGQEC